MEQGQAHREDQTHPMHIPFLGELPLSQDLSGWSRALTDYSPPPYPELSVDLGAYEGSAITLNVSASPLADVTAQPSTSPAGSIPWVRYLEIDLSSSSPAGTRHKPTRLWSPKRGGGSSTCVRALH